MRGRDLELQFIWKVEASLVRRRIILDDVLSRPSTVLRMEEINFINKKDSER